MKKLAIAAFAATFALAGCSTMGVNDTKEMVVEGQPVNVKVINIPSFKVEVSPHRAICEAVDTSGNKRETECLQYRQAGQKNYTTFNGDIQGFTYEPNYRYMLDLRQEAVTDKASGTVMPVWILNKVISKTAE